MHDLGDDGPRPAADVRPLGDLTPAERLFGSVSAVAGRLLELSGWEGVDEALHRLGEGADVQRVLLFENDRGPDGALLASLRHAWAQPGTVRPTDAFGRRELPVDAAGFGRWRRRLERGEVFTTVRDELPDVEHGLPIARDVRSLALVPIVVRDAWWGILALEDCRRGRRWTAGEIDALEVVARLFASFILRLRNTRSLVASEARLRSIVQTLPDMIFRIDADDRFTDVQVNDAGILLVPPERVHGRRLDELLPPDVAELAARHCRQARTDGSMQEFDYVLALGDERREYEARLMPCGEREVLVVCRDVTEMRDAERRLRRSEERYTAVVNDQTEPICRFLADGTLTFVNEAYCRFFGMAQEDLLGRTFTPLIPEEDQELVARMVASLDAERPLVTYEHRVHHADGSLRWMEWTDRAICDQEGAVVEYQAVGRDITERKQLQRRLLDAAAGEQQRLAQELHDVLCQDLKSLEIEAALLEDRLARGGDPDLASRAADVGRKANQALGKAYGIVRGMLPAGLGARGLVSGLDALAGRLGGQWGRPIETRLQPDLLPADDMQAYHLYHIAQEALTNALRHAQAARIRLAWGLQGDQAVLAVRDDGIGLGSARSGAGLPGVGLAVLESRAQTIGAALHIEGAPGGGTEIRCLLGTWSLDGGGRAP